MSNSLDKIQRELESFERKTQRFDSPIGVVVAFKYVIESGSHKGEPVTVGVSLQEDGYPEYPPHWIHISPPLSDGKGGSVQRYEVESREWLAMSRPPLAGIDYSPSICRHTLASTSGGSGKTYEVSGGAYG